MSSCNDLFSQLDSLQAHNEQVRQAETEEKQW